VFQCLIVDGENAGDDALRNAERYVIEDAEFKEFIERHSHVKVLVPEYSYMIKNSYLILDEYVSGVQLFVLTRWSFLSIFLEIRIPKLIL
jgi:hypothetical protein